MPDFGQKSARRTFDAAAKLVLMRRGAIALTTPPGKTEGSSVTWALDAAGQTLIITSGNNASDQWRVFEARSSADAASVTIVLNGEGKENGRTVITRKTLTRDGNRLRISKQMRVAGEPFLMRQSYELR